MYTYDILKINIVKIATFVNNTTILAKGTNADKAIQNLWLTKDKNCKMSQILTKTGTVTNKTETTNTFNGFFSSLDKKLASNISSDANSNQYTHPLEHSFHLSSLTCNKRKNKIINVVNELKYNKVPGIDHIKSETLKAIVEKT